MEKVKLGDVETEVLTYLAKHRNENAQSIAQALGKRHTAYVMGSINTLIEKNLIKQTGEYRPPRGRPAQLYSLTLDGVSLYLLNMKKDIGPVLDNYRDLDETLSWVDTIYKAFQKAGVADPDQFVVELLTINLSMVGYVTTDVNDLEAMGMAWVAQRLKKIPKSKRRIIAAELQLSSIPKKNSLRRRLRKEGKRLPRVKEKIKKMA